MGFSSSQFWGFCHCKRGPWAIVTAFPPTVIEQEMYHDKLLELCNIGSDVVLKAKFKQRKRCEWASKGFIKSLVARHLTRHNNVVVGASKNIMPMEVGILFFEMRVVVCFFPWHPMDNLQVSWDCKKRKRVAVFTLCRQSLGGTLYWIGGPCLPCMALILVLKLYPRHKALILMYSTYITHILSIVDWY
jgi:hypothetical protein